MKEFTEEEIETFELIERVYKKNPIVALAYVDKETKERFEEYLEMKLGDKSELVLEEYRELSKFKREKDNKNSNRR